MICFRGYRMNILTKKTRRSYKNHPTLKATNMLLQRDVIKAVDAIAKERGKTRTSIITKVLQNFIEQYMGYRENNKS